MVTLQEGKRPTLVLNDGRYLVTEPSDDKNTYDNQNSSTRHHGKFCLRLSLMKREW